MMLLLLQVDLIGGYYDAGDNVKFGLPMAFTITMLSWSVIEYGSQIDAVGQLQYCMDAIKWGTDYFIKARGTQPISSKLLQVLVVLSRVCCPSTIEFEEQFLNLMSSFSRILELMLDAFWPLCFGTRRALPWKLIA
jgi:hypothetical protein